MRIAIDARCLTEGRRTGVEEYTLNLLLNLFKLDKKNSYVLFFNSFKRSGFDPSVFDKFENVRMIHLHYPNKLLNFSFWYLGWPEIDRLVGGADIVFMPNIIFGQISKQARLILTMHDLSFERYPQYYSMKRRLWHIFINPKKLSRRADRVIAVSRSTKNDLVSLYKTPSEKITVIHNAVDDRFKIIDRNDERLIRVKEKYNLPYKFILFLGTIEPRKNISGVVKAYNQFAKFAKASDSKELKKYKLVIAGSAGWLNTKIFQEIRNSEFSADIHNISFVDNEDKPYLYNLASLFIYPSFFEGFGFPPLEAMRCGVPVITSNNSSLPEIAGKGAIMVDPDKPDELYRAMRVILTEQKLKEKLIKSGLEQSSLFSWENSAKETLALFESSAQ